MTGKLDVREAAARVPDEYDERDELYTDDEDVVGSDENEDDQADASGARARVTPGVG